jgi:hypothetical protein
MQKFINLCRRVDWFPVMLIVIALSVVAGLWLILASIDPAEGEDPGLYLLGGLIVGVLLCKK